MTKMKKLKYLHLKYRSLSAILFLSCIVSSCKKYLDVKPNIALEEPTTAADLQALLNNTGPMNFNDPELGVASGDEYYVTYTDWQTQSTTDQGMYDWDANVIWDNWSPPYKAIAYANVVLDYLDNVSGTDTGSIYNNLKGQALFFRAWNFFQLAQVYSPPYDSANLGISLGICLRTSSSVTAPSIRSTIGQTYTQILNDFTAAVPLLPATSVYPTTPNRGAAYGALAKTYLVMQDYPHAKIYADSCLSYNNLLMIFSTLDTSANINGSPISLFNIEDIFHCEYGPTQILSNYYAKVDTNLISLYGAHDLRFLVYFSQNPDGSFAFIGNYAGNGGNPTYDGVAVDEVYLIKAECEARLGDVANAMADLNTLLETRWTPGTFTAYTASNASQALNIILTERRKELIFRNVRWSDLKRLNQNTALAVTLNRNVNGTTYTLPPADPRYSFLIPANVISLTNIAQNPR
jgi:starch-binding outer membrane protein, SusD/RagB family